MVRDTLTERFTGGIDGEGRAEHVRYLRPDGVNTFAGIERITGTGELKGIHGRGTFRAHQQDGRWRSVDTFIHWYDHDRSST